MFDNYSFGNFEAVVQGLQFGMLQFAQESPSNLSIYDPKLLIFDLPYLMPDYDAVNILLDGKVGKELSCSLEKIGIKGMGWIALGTRFYWMNKPFHTMAEAKSMKIRATASKVHISMTKAFGMNPTPMAWSETFTALQQGTVDGEENPASLIYESKFQEVQKYLSTTEHIYDFCTICINTDFYNSLDDQAKAIVDEGVKTYLVDYQRELEVSQNDEYIQKLADAGMEITYVTPENKALFAEKVAPMYDDAAEQFGQDVMDAVAPYHGQ